MSSSVPLRAVVFDWDGTLADSAEATFRSYAVVFESFGIPFGRDRFRDTYSPNWHRTYEAVGLPTSAWDEADARWLAAYARHESPLLPGARAALDRLSPRLALGLVTSGDGSRVRGELVRLRLAEAFAVALFAADVTRRKPHPEGLLRALERLGVPPAEAVYVGDSPEDVEMARAAGARSVAIPGGYPNREALLASGADFWAEDLARVADVVLSLADGGR